MLNMFKVKIEATRSVSVNVILAFLCLVRRVFRALPNIPDETYSKKS